MRHLSLPLALLLASPLPAADPPAEPLPKGAIARLGTEKMKGLDGYGSARLHPDGKHLIATLNGKATLIELATGDPAGAFGKGTRAPVALSADGSRAVAGYSGVTVYEVATDKVLYESKGDNLNSGTYHLSGDGKFLAVGRYADSKTKKVVLSVIDVDNQKEAASLEVAQNSSATLKLSADGKRGVSWGSHLEPQPKPGEEVDRDAGPGKRLQFWDIEKGKELASAQLTAGYGSVGVAISPDGSVVAASGGDGAVVLFDTATGKKKVELLGRRGLGYGLYFSPDGKTLAATAFDGAVQLWEVGSGKSLGLAPPPADQYLSVQAVTFTGPAAAVALGQVGPAVVAWEVPSGKLISPLAGHRGTVSGVTFAANDKEVISAATGGELLRWDTAGKRLADLPLTIPGVKSEYSTNRVHLPSPGLAVRSESGGVGVYDLPAATQRFVLPAGYGTEPVLSVSADGKTLVMVQPPGYGGFGTKPKPAKLVVVDLATNTKTADHPLPLGNASGVALSPDGTTAGVFRTVTPEKGGDSKVVFCSVDVKTGKASADTEYKSGYFTPNMTATPDGKGVLTTTPNGAGLSVLKFDGGEATAVLKEYKGYPNAGPVFSKDGKKVAVADQFGANPTVTVFDWDGGKVTHTFRGHVRGVTCLAFASDGKTLASGSADGTVLLWDVSKE